MNRRDEFVNRIAALIARDAERKKLEISPDDPDAGMERREINEGKQQDLRDLRKFVYGRKNELHCACCCYYDYWEKMEFSTGKE